MNDNPIRVRKTTSFAWGAILTGIVSIPLMIGLSNTFGGLSEEKATGLGAVQAGFIEAYVILGLVLGVLLPATAIVLLVRSFSRGHRVRTLFSLFCIGCSAFALYMAGMFTWLNFIVWPRIYSGLH
jgi:hypothetical protein